MALENLFRLHEMRFAAKEKRSGFLVPEKLAFHRELIRICDAKTEYIVFSEVLDQGEVIGSNYGFLTPHRYGIFQQGHHSGYSRMGLGNLLFYHTIQFLMTRNVPVFDFLRGNEPYKFHWTSNYEIIYNVFLPMTPMGHLLLQRSLWKDQARRKGRLAGTLKWLENLIDFEIRGLSTISLPEKNAQTST